MTTTTPAPVKQPWQMTSSEFMDANKIRPGQKGGHGGSFNKLTGEIQLDYDDEPDHDRDAMVLKHEAYHRHRATADPSAKASLDALEREFHEIMDTHVANSPEAAELKDYVAFGDMTTAQAKAKLAQQRQSLEDNISLGFGFGPVGEEVVARVASGDHEECKHIRNHLDTQPAQKHFDDWTARVKQATTGLPELHHRKIIQNAIAAGHPVPDHVRAEYPELAHPPAPEARYTWYCDFLARAGIAPRPFDEWQAMQPERYTEPASQQPAAHEMTSEQAIAAGIPYHDWSHQVQDAFLNERIPEDHPAWASLKEARPDHFGGIPWVGRQVAVHGPHGRFFGTVRAAIPRGVVLEHFDGSTSRQSHDTLEDLQQWADDRTKRGRPIPPDVQERLGTPPSEPARYTVPRGWLGVDLDGCLARYDDWQSWDRIGEPVPEMVARVKQWLAEGRDVRIFTARVYGPDAEKHRRAIEQWCRQYIGRVLPITATKDPGMYEFWDDRAIQVLRNTGRPVGRYSMTAAEVDEAVRDWQPPTAAQREAGNYQKPTINWNGLRIKIENPRGTQRKPEWPELKHHYGYISRT